MLRKVTQDIQEEKISEPCTIIGRGQCWHSDCGPLGAFPLGAFL